MKRLFCDCGSQVFFDNDYCAACNTRLGFDAELMTMRSLTYVDGEKVQTRCGSRFLLCGNSLEHQVCNWLRPEDSDHSLCRACQFNRYVPNQSVPGNNALWRRLEAAKKRLFFTLMTLKLPLVDGWRDPGNGLLLDFIQDERSESHLFPESFVSTGYLGGIITINAMEADDVARIVMRLKMNEPYRTVLGHLRHESGHYYWARFKADKTYSDGFTQLFGDESQDYSAALDTYYNNGPVNGWQQSYISAYASAHPSEDWAETWGHYLHIYDALETAAEHGTIALSPAYMDVRQRIEIWSELSITLNELNRSIGHGDVYPFIINESVANKLVFVDRAIRRLQKLQ